MIFGMYVGYGSPKDSDVFLDDFATEAKLLIDNGILVGKDKVHCRFQIRAFCADAPARAYITCIKYHNAFNGCSKCNQVGFSIDRTTVYQSEPGLPRTDDTFRDRLDPDHHSKKHAQQQSVLEKINFDMVSKIPLDSMHLIDLGATKKILLLMLENKKNAFFLNDSSIRLMERTFLQFAKMIPNDFARGPRPFVEVCRYKATEFRQFLLYTGPVLLKPYLEQNAYAMFLKLHCAVRILQHPQQTAFSIDSAEYLLQNFVGNFSDCFGPKNLNYNIHNLLHIADCVRQFGSLESFSNYKFENFIKTIKGSIKKATQVLTQIKNRLDQHRFYQKTNPIVIGSETNFDQMNISLKKNNNFCLLRDGQVVELFGFENNNLALGSTFKIKKPFFEEPINSIDALGICYVEDQDETMTCFPTSEVASKLMRLPYENGFVMTPILHNLHN
jgi:hypothetical protein